MFDCGLKKENNLFRYRAAAIIVENDSVLLATNDKVDYFYSVGGGVQMGEKAQDAVSYELDKHTVYPTFLKEYLSKESNEIKHIVTVE